MNIIISAPEGFSEIGQKPTQEDALFPDPCTVSAEQRVFIVCDGMGGHEYGEVASKCVADTIGKITSSISACTTDVMRIVFEKALSEAYNRLDALDKNDEVERKMGTTLAFLAICNNGVLSAHIGDSRIYQLRKGQGVVFQSHDHSLVNDLLASGDLDEKEIKNYLYKNVITRAVQPHQEYRAKASYKVITDIREGDMFFICCDGVVEKLDNNDLVQILLKKADLKSRIERLKEECRKRETQDNYSCCAIEIAKIEMVKQHNECLWSKLKKKLRQLSIPGVSFSLKRALGITKAKQQVSRKTGIPMTKAGMERKVGNAIQKALLGK